ncbi:MAG: caspase family protein, partial [Burkholderiales bacterium]
MKYAVAVALGLAAGAALAENHALIMTISAYRAGITRLEGVVHDAASARSIARKMGVKDQNIRVYRDEQLTVQGMRAAFEDLYQRIGPDDQVFIYYSGHGGRERVRQPADRCAESLISVDGGNFLDTDLEQMLKRLSEKAHELVVFLDACHSGGVTTRAIPGAPTKTAGVTPKYVAARAGGDACERPVNVLTRSLSGTRSAGSGVNNYVYIAAARDNEVSLDMAAHGGVATQAWRDCIMGAARDTDGSGGISALEIQDCAQQRINNTLRNLKGFLPHHVTITGNPNAVLAFAERAPTPPPTPVAVPAPAPIKPPVSVFPPAYYTLRDIYSNRDDRRTVELKAAKPSFRIGVDDVDFTLTSSHAGFLYVLMVGSDGKTFDMLFPNQLDNNNAVQPGQSLRLPRANWMVKAGGPAGKNHLLAIVADSPRDFAKMGMVPAGPFSIVPASTSSSKDIQLVTQTSANAESKECEAPSAHRTLMVQKRCSNAYG